jgi:hypothetical protein
MSAYPNAEAVRLAYAILAFARANPAVLEAAPFAVISDVLAQPPWSIEWAEAMHFVRRAMQQEGGNAE